MAVGTVWAGQVRLFSLFCKVVGWWAFKGEPLLTEIHSNQNLLKQHQQNLQKAPSPEGQGLGLLDAQMVEKKRATGVLISTQF